MPQGLLASLLMAWEEIGQSTFLTMLVMICLAGLAIIGFKEWRLFQKKRKR
ncbi:MAG: hypothetical protein ACKKMR_01320 [Candidatus Nealsonbacteria bacterium]